MTIVNVINRFRSRSVIANEVKQFLEIATPACRNASLYSALRDKSRHYGVQARRPAKAGLLAMTTPMSRSLWIEY
jgi:hypothetical protein